MRVTILDGYIDEPSRLGVPPFISPYPRYAAGAAIAAGREPEYLTIDHWRSGRRPTGELLFVISGAQVPGKYLRTMPMSGKELNSVLEHRDVETHVWHSAEPSEIRSAGNGRHWWGCDPDALFFDLLTSGRPSKRRRTPEEWNKWSVLGAPLVKSHQDFPQPLICEIDMSYGCPHFMNGGCSFCTEPLFGMPVYRDEDSVVSEVKALLKAGCTNFRLGGQSCILSYKAIGVGETARPKPNVTAMTKLFRGLSGLNGISVLHTDNADPAIISSHPNESERILEMLVGTCTSGNILSLGLESADPAVAGANNLNSTPEEAFAAVGLINKVGRESGPTGLPNLLPGLNFIAGLVGETPETFELNKAFLDKVTAEGLALRRINIRQVASVRRKFRKEGHKKDYIRFKEYVRENIDPVMLGRVAPPGTVMRNLFTEVRIGKLTFSRQIGTYPLLVGIPQDVGLGRFLDARVTALGSRSLTAVEYPLDINECPLSALEALPGIGRKRALRLFNARPITSFEELSGALDDPAIAASLIQYLGGFDGT